MSGNRIKGNLHLLDVNNFECVELIITNNETFPRLKNTGLRSGLCEKNNKFKV